MVEWQTRSTQTRMPQGLGVQVPLPLNSNSMSDSIEEFGTAAQSGSDKPKPALAYRDEDYNEEVTKEAQRIKLTQWTLVGQDCWTAVSSTVKLLPPGVYRVVALQNEKIGFEQQKMQVDELLLFPESSLQHILDEISFFWTRFDIFKFHGFLHRRGYMFHGPPGSGKTCLVQQIMDAIVKQGGMVFICHKPNMLQAGLAEFRKLEPTRPIVCVFEDIDSIIEDFGDDALLSLLDGENQVDRVLNLATTNYPEKLDKRIVARPRRFDRVLKIDWPSDAVRENYFRNKLKIADAELERWIKATQKMSFAACAELVISVKCLNKDFDETVKLLRALNHQKVNSSQYDTDEAAIGFAAAKQVGFGKA